MNEELFQVSNPNNGKTCRTCAHRQRWYIGPKRVGQYCDARFSKRTSNGLLKIKVTNSACSKYLGEEEK